MTLTPRVRRFDPQPQGVSRLLRGFYREQRPHPKQPMPPRTKS